MRAFSTVTAAVGAAAAQFARLNELFPFCRSAFHTFRRRPRVPLTTVMATFRCDGPLDNYHDKPDVE